MSMRCSTFIFLAFAHEGGGPVPSIAVSSAHRPCAFSGLVIAEMFGLQVKQKFLSWLVFEPPTPWLMGLHVNHWIIAMQGINK